MFAENIFKDSEFGNPHKMAHKTYPDVTCQADFW